MHPQMHLLEKACLVPLQRKEEKDSHRRGEKQLVKGIQPLYRERETESHREQEFSTKAQIVTQAQK